MTNIKILTNFDKKNKTLIIPNKNLNQELDLKKFIKLEILDCSYNNITNIINIPKYLKYLNCSHNNIINFDLIHLPNDIKYIDCSYNKIKSLLTIPSNIEGICWESNPIVELNYLFDFVNTFPPNLSKLYFDSKNTQMLKYLPNTIKFLKLGKSIDIPLDNLNLYNLEHLILGDCYNYPLDNLPNKLKKIIFTPYSQFYQPLDNLPNSLTDLTLGLMFNHPLDNLPQTLTHLTLGDYYNQPLNNLPQNLTHLILGYNYKQSIDNLPPNLIHLTLGYSFNKPITNLPPTLTHLRINTFFRNNNSILIYSDLPNDLNDIFLTGIPDNITHLYLYEYNVCLDNYVFPKSLIYLELSYYYRYPIDKLSKLYEIKILDKN